MSHPWAKIYKVHQHISYLRLLQQIGIPYPLNRSRLEHIKSYNFAFYSIAIRATYKKL